MKPDFPCLFFHLHHPSSSRNHPELIDGHLRWHAFVPHYCAEIQFLSFSSRSWCCESLTRVSRVKHFDLLDQIHFPASADSAALCAYPISRWTEKQTHFQYPKSKLNIQLDVGTGTWGTKHLKLPKTLRVLKGVALECTSAQGHI
jgi:hypothetical protein